MDALYLEAFESLPGLVCLVSASSYVISDCNVNFECMLKYARMDLKVMKFAHVLVKESDRAYLQQVLKGPTDARIELDEMEMRTAEGTLLSLWCPLITVLNIRLCCSCEVELDAIGEVKSSVVHWRGGKGA